MTSGLSRRVAGTLAGLRVASYIVVGVTGWWLAQNYRPGPSTEFIHNLHVGSAVILQTSVVGIAVALVASVVRRSAGRLWPVFGVGLLVGATVLGFVTSTGLRWQFLAMWSAEVGSHLGGVW